MSDQSIDLGRLLKATEALEGRQAHAAALGDPCLDCECCAKWDAALQLLGEGMRYHATTERMRTRACRTDCYVCQLGGFKPQ